MSASLVGSEMCIRDRAGGGRPCGSRRPSWALRAFSEADSAAALGLAPVSYTHLTLPTICSV
eukprot:8567237-Alexandrium_andersonii.AAC.1